MCLGREQEQHRTEPEDGATRVGEECGGDREDERRVQQALDPAVFFLAGEVQQHWNRHSEAEAKTVRAADKTLLRPLDARPTTGQKRPEAALEAEDTDRRRDDEHEITKACALLE